MSQVSTTFDTKRQGYSHQLILQVGNPDPTLDEQFAEKMGVRHVCLNTAKAQILQNEPIDAIILIPNYSLSEIVELRNEALQRSIPFILYTLLFDPKIREMAVRLKVDDYQWGSLQMTTRQIEFLKKVRRFKKGHRSNGFSRLKFKKFETPLLQRCLDIVVALAFLILLFPLMLLISLIVGIGFGKIPFSEVQRAGYGYKIFTIYNFRTAAEEGKGSSWMKQLGRFLNQTGLNKLPELINLLKGDVSLVGACPLTLSEAARLTTNQVAMRLLVTPGLTGLWRIDSTVGV